MAVNPPSWRFLPYLLACLSVLAACRAQPQDEPARVKVVAKAVVAYTTGVLYLCSTDKLAEEPSSRVAPGLHQIKTLIPEKDVCNEKGCGVIYVPKDAAAGKIEPLLWVYLRGAAISAEEDVKRLGLIEAAEAYGLLLVAPEPLEETWDVMDDGLGPDVMHLDSLLMSLSRLLSWEQWPSTLSGFSDGATEALAVGTANAAIFSHVVAFSPGAWMKPPADSVPQDQRQPLVFLSYGTKDPFHPENSSQATVNALEEAGYQVNAQEFEGGHDLPPDVLETAITWVLNGTQP